MKIDRRAWAAVWLGSLVLVLLTAAQTTNNAYYSGAVSDPWRALAVAAVAILPWAMLSPLIVRVASRVPLTGPAALARILLHLLLAIAVTGAKVAVEGRIDAWIYGAEAGPVTANVYLNFVVYWQMMFAAHWVIAQLRLRERSQRAAVLEQQLAEARLQALEERLRPHFLFNSLNAVSSLVHEDADAADDAIERLGGLLRRALDDRAAPTVALQREIDFGRDYLALEGLRLGDRLQASWHIEPGAAACQVPSFLLQPLLENAVRHGIAPRSRGGRIEIRALRDDSRLRLTVVDDGDGVGAEIQEGVGLGATRERLRRLFGDQATLTIEAIAAGGTCVRVEIPA